MRNACIRPGGLACAYDWELACLHVPQYDLAEFLSFSLDRAKLSHLPFWLETYRQELAHASGWLRPASDFIRGFEVALRHFIFHRLGMYLIAHTLSPYPYLPRVISSAFELHDSLQTAHKALSKL